MYHDTERFMRGLGGLFMVVIAAFVLLPIFLLSFNTMFDSLRDPQEDVASSERGSEYSEMISDPPDATRWWDPSDWDFTPAEEEQESEAESAQVETAPEPLPVEDEPRSEATKGDQSEGFQPPAFDFSILLWVAGAGLVIGLGISAVRIALMFRRFRKETLKELGVAKLDRSTVTMLRQEADKVFVRLYEQMPYAKIQLEEAVSGIPIWNIKRDYDKEFGAIESSWQELTRKLVSYQETLVLYGRRWYRFGTLVMYARSFKEVWDGLKGVERKYESLLEQARKDLLDTTYDGLKARYTTARISLNEHASRTNSGSFTDKVSSRLTVTTLDRKLEHVAGMIQAGKPTRKVHRDLSALESEINGLVTVPQKKPSAVPVKYLSPTYIASRPVVMKTDDYEYDEFM